MRTLTAKESQKILNASAKRVRMLARNMAGDSNFYKELIADIFANDDDTESFATACIALSQFAEHVNPARAAAWMNCARELLVIRACRVKMYGG